MTFAKLTSLAALTVLAVANLTAADEYRWYNGRWHLVRTPSNGVTAEAGSPFSAAAGTGNITPQRNGGGGSAATAATSGTGSAAAGTVDLQRLESRIATLQMFRAISEIRERLGMKPAGDGTLPLSTLSSTSGTSDSLLVEMLAQRLAGMGTTPPAIGGCPSPKTSTTPVTTPSVDPELQASQTTLELLQAWKAEQEHQKVLNDGYKAKLKELEELQTKLAAERKARLEEITKKINELKPTP
jgi:hypothetical protein